MDDYKKLEASSAAQAAVAAKLAATRPDLAEDVDAEYRCEKH
jgi:hypothetical protein